LARGVSASSLSVGSLLATCEHRRLLSGELHVLQHLAQGGLRSAALNAVASRLLQADRFQEAREILRGAAVDGCFNAVSRELWRIAAPESVEPVTIHSSMKISSREPHEKELRLLEHVLSTAQAGNVPSICEAVETFGHKILEPSGQWLKIAGDEKAEVLVRTVSEAPTGKDGIKRVLEVGTYCGYSSLRIATGASSMRADLAIPKCHTQVLTLDSDPARVIIARSLIAFAGLSDNVTVQTGWPAHEAA